VYKSIVDRCAAHRLNYQIANGSALHARILIEKLFEVAKREVLLVSGTVREKSTSAQVEIYSYTPLVERARGFLSKPGTKLSVVVQTGAIDKDGANKFLHGIIDAPDRLGDVTIYLPNANALNSSETPHFMVSDRETYRFETGTDATPGNEAITAVANFGDAATAQELGAMFDDIVSLLNTDDNLRSKQVYLSGTKYQ
jgi:hypothetical protein